MSTLEDVCEVITCGVAKRPQYVKDGVPFLSSKNVKEDRFILKHYNCVTEEDYELLTKHNRPEKGDILYTRVGSFGEAAVVNIDFKFAIFVSLTLIKPKTDIVYPRFLMHYLNSEKIRQLAYSSTSGIGVQNLNVSTVRKFPIDLPPLPQQKKIAAILDAADAYRQKTKALISKYNELTQSLFLDMFGDPVTNPKGWEKTPTINYCDCIVPGRDKPKSFTGNTPWITTADLIHLGHTYTSRLDTGLSQTEIDEVRAKVIPKNSVIMTCVGDLGVVSINAEDIVMNQQLHAFICHKQLNNVFLMHNLSYQTPYMNKMASSTTVPYMNKAVANNTPTILPPITLQNQFTERVQVIEAQKAQAEASLAQADNLFNSLLQRAFKGELV